jgi:YesN/AraC family two-component response regulator
MQSHKNFVQYSNFFRMQVDHAEFGTIDLHGKNTLPMNRIYVIYKVKNRGKSYIANHSSNIEQKIILLPGHIYFMPKDQTLEYNFAPRVKLAAYHFSMEVTPGIDLFDSEERFMEREISTTQLEDLKSIVNNQDGMGDMARLYGFLYSQAGRFSKKTVCDFEHESSAMKQFDKLIEFIESEADAQTTVGSLAEMMNLNQDTLSKRFIRASGIPLKTFMTRSLVRKAVQVLLATDLKISDVSIKLGFSSEFYFCRFFKKHTGMTPNSYRKGIW